MPSRIAVDLEVYKYSNLEVYYLLLFYRVISTVTYFCQRRSQPLAYKLLFFSSSSSSNKDASFLDIVLFKKLFEYTQHLLLSSLSPLRNSGLAVVL